ncbi:MAG: hypothetical protein RL210_2617 [Pseudomonadota bacterium]|jgi:hypothetical protein|nr:hypothetical protein [Pseudomonadota bacterium]
MLMQDTVVNEDLPAAPEASRGLLDRVLTGLFVLGMLATMLDFNTLLA